MLAFVDVGNLHSFSYRGIARTTLLDAVSDAARALRGARVLHLNATPYGGGVSELLRSVGAAAHRPGRRADWRIISATSPSSR
jgi:trehalose synthase